jgi:hypothetical protein
VKAERFASHTPGGNVPGVIWRGSFAAVVLLAAFGGVPGTGVGAGKGR